MAGIRYIGSKVRVVGAILDRIGPPPDGARFVDAMSGSGIVSRAAAERGWSVLANDHLACASVMTHARLVRRGDVSFAALGNYEAAVAALDAVPGSDGFIAAEYAPTIEGAGRRYFTRENARRIDAIRSQIDAWAVAGAITPVEQHVLLGDLLDAVNRVANTAGTFGCFLSDWSAAALRPLALVARALPDDLPPSAVTRGDAAALATTPADVLYLDPPYTKRQYAAYYHVLETIVYNDAPAVGGVTGLRAWRHLASDFCFRRRAPAAFQAVLHGTNAARVFVSYNEQGHLELDELRAILGLYGDLSVHEVGTIGRYRSNAGSVRTGAHVREYLFELVSAPRLIP